MLNPDFEEGWIAKAKLFNKLERHHDAELCYQTALKTYDRALVSSPKDKHKLLGKTDLLIQLGRYDEAVKVSEFLIANFPKELKSWQYRLSALLKNNMLDGLISSCDEAMKSLQMTPPDESELVSGVKMPSILRKWRDIGWEIWNYKGMALHELNRFDEALKSFDMAAKSGGNNPEVFLNRSVTLIAMHNYKEAMEILDSIVSTNKVLESAWIAKANILTELGKHEDAVTSYEKATSINMKNDVAWCLKGRALHRLGKYRKAIGCFDEAIGISENYEQAWCGKGEALLALGDTNKALEYFDVTLEIDPGYIDAIFLKGAALEKLGKNNESLECYSMVKGLDPGYAEVDEKIKWLEIKLMGNAPTGAPEKSKALRKDAGADDKIGAETESKPKKN
jgi:tetratricopeptide (TPR) repeat protein